MSVSIAPRHQKLIDDAIISGACSAPQQYVDRALDILALEEEFLHQQKDAINAKIARGLAQLDQGLGIPGDVARARLQARKAAFLRNTAPFPA